MPSAMACSTIRRSTIATAMASRVRRERGEGGGDEASNILRPHMRENGPLALRGEREAERGANDQLSRDEKVDKTGEMGRDAGRYGYRREG